MENVNCSHDLGLNVQSNEDTDGGLSLVAPRSQPDFRAIWEPYRGDCHPDCQKEDQFCGYNPGKRGERARTGIGARE